VEGVDESTARECLQRLAQAHSEALASIASQSKTLLAVARLIVHTAGAGSMVMSCGNGGSAADAQHLAAELVGRFEGSPMSLPCIALCVDPAVMTSVANDYGYEDVFAHQVTALGRPGDLLIAFSTSGTSANILRAAREARKVGMRVVGFIGSGAEAGGLSELADVVVCCDACATPRIQEAHGFAVHAVCELVRTLRLA
jgi:D-sedoheptulose 7-phosphate isomerase